MVLPQGTMLTVTGEVRDNRQCCRCCSALWRAMSAAILVYVTDEALATATPATERNADSDAGPDLDAGSGLPTPAGCARRRLRAYGGLKLRQHARHVLRHAGDHALRIGRDRDGRSA